MSESVFEKLLGSYSGMRKRTWTPHVIEEAELSDEQKQVFTAAAKAFETAVGGTPVMGQGSRRNINFEPVQDQPGKVKISGSNLTPKIFDQTSFNNYVRADKAKYPTSFAYRLATAWFPKQDGEKQDDEKSKETQPETEPTQQLPGFTQTQRDGIAEYIEQKEDEDPTFAQKIVQKIQDSIVKPLERRKLASVLRDRPDLATAIQTQFLDLTSRFFSMAGKVEKATLADGTEVKFIRGERLSAGDRKAGRVITVRGNNGTGGVHFGRGNGETISEYADMQTYSRAYDHKTYGFALGSNVSKYGPNLHNTRILPEGVDISSMTKEEFEELDSVVRKSVSSTGKEPIDDNATVGHLWEDVLQMGAAIDSGTGKVEALKQLKTRLEKLKELENIDMEIFESPLLSGEVDDLEGLIGNAPNIGEAVKSKLRLLSKQYSAMKKAVGMGAILRSERPSQDSSIGERTDNRFILADPLSDPYFADVTEENENGEHVLEISAKQMNSPTSDTPLGSNKVSNMLGQDTEKYDQLHDEHLERAVQGGHVTEEQAQSCRDALEHDREVFDGLVKTFGDLTKPNKQALGSYYDSLIAEAPGQFDSVAAQMKYVNYLKGLKKDLKDKNVNPRQAAMKLLQLHRMKKAATDRDYAAGMFFNDSVLSMGSYKNELLLRGSPVDISMAKTHDLANQYAKAAFSEDFKIDVGLASVSLKTKEGDVVSKNRVAGKENKQFVEHYMGNLARKLFGRTYSL